MKHNATLNSEQIIRWFMCHK